MTKRQEQSMRDRHRAIDRSFAELEAILALSAAAGIGGLVWLGWMLLAGGR